MELFAETNGLSITDRSRRDQITWTMANAIGEDAIHPHRARTKRTLQKKQHYCKTELKKTFISFVDKFTSYQNWIERTKNIKILRNHYHSNCSDDLKDLQMDISCLRSDKPQEFYFCDWNLEIPDALWRYNKLLSLFNTSLIKIQKSSSNEKNITVRNLTGVVKKEWHQLSRETHKLVKQYQECGTTINEVMGENITEDRIIHPYKKLYIKGCDDRTQAGTVYNQLVLVLDVMKEDLERRKKYLKWCAKS